MEKSKIIKDIINSPIKLYNSVKEIELDKILEKITNKLSITNSEKDFLKNFDLIKESEIKDYSLLSKTFIESIIKELLDKNIKVICNLSDRNGKINSPIISIENGILVAKIGNRVKLTDDKLYNLIYNLKRKEYSLELAGEYYEVIEK